MLLISSVASIEYFHLGNPRCILGFFQTEILLSNSDIAAGKKKVDAHPFSRLNFWRSMWPPTGTDSEAM